MILPLLLSISLTCDTVPLKITVGVVTVKPMTHIAMGGNGRKYWAYYDSLNNSITVDSLSFKITGDTLAALQGLFKMFWKQSEERYAERDKDRKDLQTAVDYTNSLPAWLKRGARWDRYQKALKRRGYVTRTIYPKQSKKISKTL